MKAKFIRMSVTLLPLLLAGLHHPVVHAGNAPAREKEAHILWHYPQTRLQVDCGLPPGTVVDSVSLPLPPGVSPGVSRLSLGEEDEHRWTLLDTSLPGLSVRAVLDSNGRLTGDGSAPGTVLRLELLRDGRVSPGWLTVPEQHLWWNVYDPDTHTLLWRGRIVWKGRMKIDTEQDDAGTGEEDACA